MQLSHLVFLLLALQVASNQYQGAPNPGAYFDPSRNNQQIQGQPAQAYPYPYPSDGNPQLAQRQHVGAPIPQSQAPHPSNSQYGNSPPNFYRSK